MVTVRVGHFSNKTEPFKRGATLKAQKAQCSKKAQCSNSQSIEEPKGFLLGLETA